MTMPMTWAVYQIKRLSANARPVANVANPHATNADTAQATSVLPVAVAASANSRAGSVMSGTRRRIAPAISRISRTFAIALLTESGSASPWSHRAVNSPTNPAASIAGQRDAGWNSSSPTMIPLEIQIDDTPPAARVRSIETHAHAPTTNANARSATGCVRPGVGALLASAKTMGHLPAQRRRPSHHAIGTLAISRPRP